jgi:hypothetical protein
MIIRRKPMTYQQMEKESLKMDLAKSKGEIYVDEHQLDDILRMLCIESINHFNQFLIQFSKGKNDY